MLILTLACAARSQQTEPHAADSLYNRYLLIHPNRFEDARKALEADRGSIIGTIVAAGIDTTNNQAIIITAGPKGEPTASRFAAASDQTAILQKMTTDAELRLFSKPPAAITRQKQASPAAKLNQEGRVYFMVQTTLKSAPLYLWGFNAALTKVPAEVNAGIGLLSVGASLYGSYRFTTGRELGYGKVAMMNYGGELGVVYPLFISWILQYGTDFDALAAETEVICTNAGTSASRCDTTETIESPRPSAQVRAWGSMLGFPLGIYLGAALNLVDNDSYGNAAIIRDISRFGALYGFVIPNLFDLNSNEYRTIGAALSMAFIPAGFYFGHKLVEGKDYSSGRAIMISTAGAMGSLTGLFLPTLFENRPFQLGEEAYSIATLAGHAAGTWFGFNYDANRSYSLGQGVFHALSAAVGAGVGLALPFIAQAADHRVYVAGGILGSWGGLLAGERVSRSLFGESNSAREREIDFPIFAELPAFLSGIKLAAGCDIIVRARVAAMRF